MSSLTVSELKVRRRALEAEVMRLVKEFENETKVVVTDFYLTREDLANGSTTLIQAWAALDLPR